MQTLLMTKIAATILQQVEIIQPLLIPPLPRQLLPEIAQLQLQLRPRIPQLQLHPPILRAPLQLRPRILRAPHKIRHRGLVRVRAVQIQIAQPPLTVLLVRAVILLERLSLATVETIRQSVTED